MLLLPLVIALVAPAAFASSLPFPVNFNGVVDVNGTPTVLDGLTATAQFTQTSFTYDSILDRTTLTFQIALTNTSDSTIWQSSVITAIGFNVDPDALEGSSSGIFLHLVEDGSFPTGWGIDVEWCASGNQNTCNGPGNTALGIGDGATATVTLVFDGDITGAPVQFSNFGIRWQALDSDRYGISDGSGIGLDTPPVPEPTSAAVFGLGALIVGAALRRKRAA
jgi:hypothetical protein